MVVHNYGLIDQQRINFGTLGLEVLMLSPSVLDIVSVVVDTRMSVSCCDPMVKSKRAELKSFVTSIDDLPEVALVEILCRLPSCKYVVQCKCVSKRWCNVLSDSYLVGRFLWLKLEKRAPIITQSSPVVNGNFGRQLFTAEVFARLRSLLGLTRDSLVLALWNDLALCCANRYHHPGYFICNPRTMQLVTLPPVPRCDRSDQPVGFICEPYYYKEDHSDIGQHNQRKVIKINDEFRFKVVRILRPDKPRKTCFKFKIQVFSSEVGEWRELVVPCPRGCPSWKIMSHGFAGNGMLYWNADNGLLVLAGPFTNGADDLGYQFHVIWTFMDKYVPVCLGVYQGCLLFYDYSANSESPIFELCTWKLTEEELNQMAADGGGKLGRKHNKLLNLMFLMDDDSDKNMDLCDTDIFGFKPTNLDVFYVRMGEAIFKGNIRTGWLSEVDVKSYHDENSLSDVSLKIFRSVLPWPTPVPRLPHMAVASVRANDNCLWIVEILASPNLNFHLLFHGLMYFFSMTLHIKVFHQNISLYRS